MFMTYDERCDMPIPRYDGWILGEIRNFDIHEVLIPLSTNESNEHSGLNHFSGLDRFTYVQFRLCQCSL